MKDAKNQFKNMQSHKRGERGGRKEGGEGGDEKKMV